MQKMMKNWVFSLITGVLLLLFSVWLILDGLDVGGLHVADRMLHLIAAVALALYAVFVLFPLVVRYGGMLRGFVLGEIAILLLAALAHFCMEWFALPLISSIEICAVFGLALWLRGAVEILHAYFSVSDQDPQKRIPLWRLLFSILLCTVGVWQLVNPLLSDSMLLLAVGAVAGVMALAFFAITLSGYKASAPARAAKKQAIQEKKAAEAAAAQPPVAESSVSLTRNNEENKPKEG